MAESLDKQLEIADIYAAALFELARAANAVEAVRREVEELARLEQTDPGFAAFLGFNAIDVGDRRSSLERMFRGKLSDVVVDTLQVMNGHGRVHLLEALARSFAVRQERAAGQVEVTVTSAVELTSQQKTEVEALAAELSGKRPLLTCRVDPEVVGGLSVEIGGYRFDYSLRRQLQMARTQLLERSERGLALGAANG
jgi:F-type H+-transporting ATPase subunit delta